MFARSGRRINISCSCYKTHYHPPSFISNICDHLIYYNYYQYINSTLNAGYLRVVAGAVCRRSARARAHERALKPLQEAIVSCHLYHYNLRVTQ